MVKSFRVLCCAAALLPCLRAADPQSAAAIATALSQISLDPARTYRVRELQLTRGDIKIYLTEGVLSFVTPIGDRRVGAVFTTEAVEAGDAEVLVLPPQRSERASLASFTKSPNLDEHFTSAVFFFSDDTAQELLAQINEKPVRAAPELAAQFAPVIDPLIRSVSSDMEVRLVKMLLDNHQPAQGFFMSLIAGRELGNFEVLHEPTDFEPVSVGRISLGNNGARQFQLWTAFRPRRAPAYVPAALGLKDYRIDAAIHPDLSMSVSATFTATAEQDTGRVIPFALSERLKVISATVDDQPAEVFQRDSVLVRELNRGGTFLLITGQPLAPGTEHRVSIRYEGSVIRQAADGAYFVDERNAWYPQTGPTLTNFDLTFHCPARLRLVSTGELVSDEMVGDERVVHRKTQVPEALAGFNLGDYNVSTEDHGGYRVECFANKPAGQGALDIPKATEDVLDYYTRRWMKLPIHSIAVSPIPGYFGQGFPGLIYLSTVSYIREEDRPAQLRNPRMDAFFSELLLPHEVAHQWWGNMVVPAEYRANWLMEAMANYSALQFVGQTQGSAAVQSILERYRDDLTQQRNGKPLDAAGPVDFGVRLIDAAGASVWHTIIYEKGTWILHMLHERLGDRAFNEMQVRMLREFRAQPLTNEAFRKLASEFVPSDQPDRTLSLFFDTWIYGTGIPKMTLHHTNQGAELNLGQVDDDFAADVPLPCNTNGRKQLRWVRASSGTNTLELRPQETCELPSSTELLYSR